MSEGLKAFQMAPTSIRRPSQRVAWIAVPASVCALLLVASASYFEAAADGRFAAGEATGTNSDARPRAPDLLARRARPPPSALLARLDAIASGEGAKTMGHSGTIGDEAIRRLTAALVQHAPRGASTVCEMGFNVGHGAALFLSALPSVRSFAAFDTAQWPELYAGLEYLRHELADVSFLLVEGTTEGGVPPWIVAGGAGTCDVVHIDACHDLACVQRDAVLALAMLRGPGSLIVFDDCACDHPPPEAHWCAGPTTVFDALVSAGNITSASRGVISSRVKGTCMGVMRAPPVAGGYMSSTRESSQHMVRGF